MAELSPNDDSGIYVEPSDWYTDPDLSVFYSQPRFDEREAAQLVKAWIVKQGRSWPMALDALTLTEMSRLVYVPYVFLSAKVAFSWSGTAVRRPSRQVWKREFRRERLDGSIEYYDVPTLKEYTVRYPVSGTVSEAPVDVHVSDTNVFSAQCSLPDFEKAVKSAASVSEFDGDQFLLLQPECRTAQDVDRVLHDHLSARLANICRGMVKRPNLVKFSVTSVDFLSKASWVHLYPVILSSYMHRDREYRVQIDGHTRHVHVDVPWTVRLSRKLRRPFSVRTRRLVLRISEAVFWFIAIVLGVSYLAVGFWLLTGRMS